MARVLLGANAIVYPMPVALAGANMGCRASLLVAALISCALIGSPAVKAQAPAAGSQAPTALDSLLEAGAARVYLDMPGQFHDYIKAEIPYVNYVRDRSLAEVHILLTSDETGSGGTAYTITLMGQKKYKGISDTLAFAMEASETEDATRITLARLLKRGLMRYVEKTPAADCISIAYTARTAAAKVKDRWDYWVFSLSSNGSINAEKSWNSMWINSSLDADRVTPELKIGLSVGTNYNESNFDVASGSTAQTVTSITHSEWFDGFIAGSLGEHWSIGGAADLYASTYENIDILSSIGPAIEYDVFPYSACTRRQFRIAYWIYYRHFRYIEETIYDRWSENLAREELSATYEVKERWGSISARLFGSHYVHDFEKNRLGLSGNLSLRIFAGLSLTLSGNANMIHDRISLAKGDANKEEVLLRRKQLDTQYSYYAYFGFKYSFGSIYSNVVNPRFGI